jgi:monofunctional glycosyltransferase
MSLPYMFLAKAVELLKLPKFEADFAQCMRVVEANRSAVPTPVIRALVIAEDHRNHLHSGIDPIGIARAAFVRIAAGSVQGASTIEQQFVRCVTGRYERTLNRKVREQLLALRLCSRASKDAIASAYLAIAFYGEGCEGLEGIRSHFGGRLRSATFEHAMHLVAQLKYPRPRNPTRSWNSKIARRVDHLLERSARAANKGMQLTAKSVTPFAFAKRAPLSSAADPRR